MTRLWYALLWLAAAPLALARLAWRSRRQPGYLAALGERFGSYPAAVAAPRIWLHAVSVGETRAAAPIVAALARRHPRHRILITHMTPTGRATGVELFGDRVERAWLPYDMSFATRRFLAHYRPQLGIVLETEIWPRLLEECARARVPVVLANARLSERSARRYARFPALTRWALGNLAGIAAQSAADAQRFRDLGAGGVEITGNVKFDLAPEPEIVARGAEFRSRFGAGRTIWVAGSTREGEEAGLLEAFSAMGAPESALLVLVPRHPHRFEEVAALASRQGFAVARRSGAGPVPPTVRVLVGDSMGEMPAYYAAADVVIMGGSLLPYGSQNLIEACALAKPVIVGPHTYNFEEAAECAIHAGGAMRVRDAGEALAAAAELARDAERRERMGESARTFVAVHRGAVDRLMAWLESRIPREGLSSPGIEQTFPSAPARD
ncbi:MAG: lipid IV(A) 3-deoxy-D-manno-octulosonic acid transferase [Usitatibacter sp.]